MPRVPSQRWKVVDVLSTVRELAKSTNQSRVLSEQGKYFYKSALSEIVALLNNSTDPSYFTGPTTLTLSTTISSASTIAVATIGTTLQYDRLVSIAFEDWGHAVKVTANEYFSIGRPDFQHHSYADDIVWTQMGDVIHFSAGIAITGTASTAGLFYQRQPNYPTNWTSDYVDLADRWVPLLIKRIHTLMILQTEADIPRNLHQEMALDYESIGAYAQAEVLNKRRDTAVKRDRFDD
jgi:hypothetical protein